MPLSQFTRYKGGISSFLTAKFEGMMWSMSAMSFSCPDHFWFFLHMGMAV